MQNQKGNIVLIIAGIIAVAILAGGVGYFVAKKPAQKEEQKQEKQANQQQIQQEQKPISEITEQKTEQSETKDETADWKTYRDEKYGFEFKYPYNIKFYVSDPIQLDELGQNSDFNDIFNSYVLSHSGNFVNADKTTEVSLINKIGRVFRDDYEGVRGYEESSPFAGHYYAAVFKNDYIGVIITDINYDENKDILDKVFFTFKFIK